MLARERDQRDLHEILPGQVVDGETHAVHRNRAVRNRHLPHRVGHAQVVHPGVPMPLDPLHHRDPVHVPLDDVAAQPIRRPQRALQIHRPSGAILGEKRPALRGLDHVDLKPTLHTALHGETAPFTATLSPFLRPLYGARKVSVSPVSRVPFPAARVAFATRPTALTIPVNIAAYPIPIMYQSPEPFAPPASSAARPRAGAAAPRERPERRPLRATPAPAPNRAGPPDRRRGAARRAPRPPRTTPTGPRPRAACGDRPATSWGGTRARRCSRAGSRSTTARPATT